MGGFDDLLVWGVNSGNMIYRWSGQTWEHIDGLLKVVSCGTAGVWGVNSADQIWYRKGTYGGQLR